MNEMEELEQLVLEQEPERAPSKAAMNRAAFAYHAAIVLIDLITSYTVGILTIWYYGVVWFLANAVVFFLHHSNWERPENNETQNKNAVIGMAVSVGSMFVVAAASGALYLAGIHSMWVQVGLEVFAVSTFFFHAGMFAFYRFSDDSWKIQNQIAKARANANKKVEIAKAAGLVVEANKRALTERKAQAGKHGSGVFDAALAKVERRDFRPAMTANASAVKDNSDVTLNPTNGQSDK